MSTPLYGKPVADSVWERVKREVQELYQTHHKRPGLAVVLIGDNPASKAYVGSKKKACEALGITSFEHVYGPEFGQSRLLQLIDDLNQNPDVHGILVQLPLPKGYDETEVLDRINPSKDVDGFHPFNVGKLLQGLPTFQSCTPYGVMKILEYYGIDPSGKHAVIVGRSNIVGKPMAAMLVQKAKGANATVTICHSGSSDITTFTKQADILVAAVGIPYFIAADMVKPNAVVIDVGINKVDAPETDRGYKIVGDVHYESVTSVASAITPVPGGVGPMTIAMLMSNTLDSFKQYLTL